MPSSSVVLMDDSNGKWNYTSNPVVADNWKTKLGYYSISIAVNNFQGRLSIQASLAKNPEERDWFTVELNGESYLEYPQIPLEPTGDTGDTSITLYTFVGSYKWLRAKIDRTYLIPEDPDYETIGKYGNVRKILLSY